eukprot:237674-Amphidinium_carterae.1
MIVGSAIWKWGEVFVIFFGDTLEIEAKVRGMPANRSHSNAPLTLKYSSNNTVFLYLRTEFCFDEGTKLTTDTDITDLVVLIFLYRQSENVRNQCLVEECHVQSDCEA